MDEQRFDDLTRTLATTRTRRSVLKGVLGVAGGMVALAAGQSRTESAWSTSVCLPDGQGGYVQRLVPTAAVPLYLNKYGAVLPQNGSCAVCEPLSVELACQGKCEETVDLGCGQTTTCPECPCIPLDPTEVDCELQCGQIVSLGCGQTHTCAACPCVPLSVEVACEGHCGETVDLGCNLTANCAACPCVPLDLEVACQGKQCGEPVSLGCNIIAFCPPCDCEPANPAVACKGRCGETIELGCEQSYFCDEAVCCVQNSPYDACVDHCGEAVDLGCGEPLHQCQPCDCHPGDPFAVCAGRCEVIYFCQDAGWPTFCSDGCPACDPEPGADEWWC